MKNFSRTLIELYEAAEHVSIPAFPNEVIRLLQTLIQFDGAVLGMGESPPGDRSDLTIIQAHVHARDRSILGDFARISDQDPITKMYMQGLMQPLCCDCRSLYRIRKLPSLQDFARRHGLRKLMLFGSAADTARPQWVVLYRDSDRSFTAKDRNTLHVLWPHLERSIAINRTRNLEREVRLHESRAAALISRHGFIEAADPAFRELLTIEWSASSLNRLPEHVLAQLLEGRNYAGARIRISSHIQHDLIVCKAYRNTLLTTLTPTELAVAQHFSAGLTHKDVARHLGVSQNTVRTHIRHVYDKLAIHDKARLAHLMAANTLR